MPVPGAQVVRVVTHDYAFEMPDSIPAGLTTFRLQNEGREPHHLMLYRIEPGRTLRDVLAAVTAGGANPGWMHPVGGPNSVPHGGESVGTVILTPGRYVAFCHVKSADLTLHLAKGMMKQLTVTATPARVAALPASDLTLTLRDYAFAFSQPPVRGRHRILVRNAGTRTHEVILSRLLPGRTTRDFITWVNTRQGPSPAVPSGGTTDLPPGGSMVIDVTLVPGTYSMVCRAIDPGDRRPHDEHGMFAQFVVR